MIVIINENKVFIDTDSVLSANCSIEHNPSTGDRELMLRIIHKYGGFTLLEVSNKEEGNQIVESISNEKNKTSIAIEKKQYELFKDGCEYALNLLPKVE